MKLFILLLTKVFFVIGIITGLSLKLDGICHSRNLSHIYTICCRHFQLVGNSCIECQEGYHTLKEGTKCEPCPHKLYGRKCAYDCNCKGNDRCDNENGICIPPSTSTIPLSEYLTFSEYQNQSTTEESERVIQAKEAKYIAVATTNYAIQVYLIMAGLIIMVLCAVAAVYKYNNKQNNVTQSIPKHGVIDSTPPPIIARRMQPSVVLEVDNSGGAYELIDDNNVLNL